MLLAPVSVAGILAEVADETESDSQSSALATSV